MKLTRNQLAATTLLIFLLLGLLVTCTQTPEALPCPDCDCILDCLACDPCTQAPEEETIPVPVPIARDANPTGRTHFNNLGLGHGDTDDHSLLFDGNAQDFYIALDDSADDLLIGLGSTVGTTPGFGLDENLAITTYGDLTFGGTTPVLTVGDAGAEDTAIVFDGNADDFYIALDDSADDLVIGYGSSVGTDPRLTLADHLTTTTWTIGDAAEGDMALVFDGAAQDFYIALDDSADDLLIGLGSTVGTTPGFGLDENLAVAMYGDVTMGGTTPVLTVGDAGEEDAALVFDGAAQDFYVGLDDTADDLVVGLGSALGTTLAFAVDENQVTTWTGGTIALAETLATTDTLTASECGKIVFLSAATEFPTTLPALSAVSAGCTFEFIIAAAPSGASYTVITGNSLENKIYGSVTVDGAAVPGSQEDTVTFADGNAALGDWVRLVSDGTNWYVSGQGEAAGSITLTAAD
jgi:hypothetical protein